MLTTISSQTIITSTVSTKTTSVVSSTTTSTASSTMMSTTTVLGALFTYNNETCTNDNQCESPLICNLAGSSCNCPLSVPLNKCDCLSTDQNEYFYNGTTCVPSASYGEPCTFNYTCQILTQNTICDSFSGTCECDSSIGLWFNSSMCLSCPTNWQLFYNSCIIGSSNAISYSSLNSTIIQDYCYNVSNTKVAKMHVNNDVFAYQLISIDGFPQPYYFFDSYRMFDGSGYISSDGLYFLAWDAFYWDGSNIPANNCSLFKQAGQWWLASDCNSVHYFICEFELV
jgi:hypothetical protein